jgi:hypothetical protein
MKIKVKNQELETEDFEDEEPKVNGSRDDMLKAGKGADHFTFYGTILTSYAQQRFVLFVLVFLLLVSIGSNVVFAFAWTNREIWVFVKDHLGEVVVADKEQFLRGNDKRGDNEIKGFVMQFLRDAYEFTPLNVRDKFEYAMRFVEPHAQGVVADGLRIVERRDASFQRSSVKIEDDIDRGKVPGIDITSRARGRYVVAAVFSRVKIDSAGKSGLLPPMMIQLQLREIPRNPHNPNGLLVVGLTVVSGS